MAESAIHEILHLNVEMTVRVALEARQVTDSKFFLQGHRAQEVIASYKTHGGKADRR